MTRGVRRAYAFAFEMTISRMKRFLAIIISLPFLVLASPFAVKGDTNAVPDMARLLSSPDPGVAVAAAKALGKTGGPEALAALQSAWRGSGAGVLHDAVNDGLAACANRLLTNGEGSNALPVFQELYHHEKERGVRQTAFRGVILASGKRGIALMVKAVAGNDAPSRDAALQLASTVGGRATTEALAGLLPKLPVPEQTALLQALDKRGDRYAAPDIAELLDSPDLNVRLAAIKALENLGGGEVAMRLARQAATASGAEQAAARQALTKLKHGPVTQAMLKLMATASPEVKAELRRALENRPEGPAALKTLKQP